MALITFIPIVDVWSECRRDTIRMRISFARYCDLYLTQIHIDPAVWYIAVGLGHPGGAGAAKGWVVHPLKTYMSWVQNVARQFGSIS